PSEAAGNGISAIVYGPGHKLWVSTNEGLFVRQGKTFQPVLDPQGQPLKAPTASLLKDLKDRIWLATGGDALGLWVIAGADNQVRRVDLRRAAEKTPTSPALCASQMGGKTRIWVSNGNCLYSVNPDGLAVEDEGPKLRKALQLADKKS